MKYFFQIILSGCIGAALANSNLPMKPENIGSSLKDDSTQYNFNNNYFIAGSNSKKIEKMFSELKQHLVKLREEMKSLKGLFIIFPLSFHFIFLYRYFIYSLMHSSGCMIMTFTDCKLWTESIFCVAITLSRAYPKRANQNIFRLPGVKNGRSPFVTQTLL